MDVELAAKVAALRADLATLPGALVAFSAGVDSSYLLAEAHAVLKDRCLAVIADSASLPRRTLARARALCSERGIRLEIVASDEFSDEAYLANDGQRCGICKAALLRAMHALLARAGDRSSALLIGALAEDFADYRPGLAAAREGGARWPLADAGLTKPEVRVLSRALGLSTADQAAEPCLASRIPYGEPVSPEILAMVEQAEAWLHDAGFRDCRVRHHRVGGHRGHLARIEVPSAALEQVLAQREAVLAALRAAGYMQVALDLAGLASGGLNALLSAEERAAVQKASQS